MSQVSDDTIVDPIARRVVALLERGNIQQQELAEHLRMGKSGLSRALRRPGGLRNHLQQVADFFNTTPEALAGKAGSGSDEESGVIRAARAITAQPDERAVPPACLLVRLARESSGLYHRARWALLGPPVMQPDGKDLVGFRMEEGEGYHIREYQKDVTGRQVVLTYRNNEAAPMCFPRDKAPELRVVLMLGEQVKGQA